MTLILTAISKNGICICADKRYRIKTVDGSIKIDDNNHKVFRLNDLSLVIINHGINNIKNRDWKDYCSDYKSSGRWKGKNQFQIVNDFKEFIEKDAIGELNSHRNEQYAIGFLG